LRIDRHSYRCRKERPGWQRGWSRDGQPSPRHPPQRLPSVLGLLPRQRIRPPAGGMPRRQTPCSHFERRYRQPGALPRSQERRVSRHTNDGHSTPQGALPPTSLDAVRSGLRPSRSRTSRHRISALPPKTRLPAGVHNSTLESLDLRTPRLFTGSPRPPAACRLLQQNVTRARHRSRPTSNVRHSKLRHRPMVSTTSGETSRASSGQGSDGRTCCVTPTLTTARVGGFTPT